MVSKRASWDIQGRLSGDVPRKKRKKKEKKKKYFGPTENLKAAKEFVEIFHRIGVAGAEVGRGDNHLVQIVHEDLQNGVQHARAVENSGTQDIAESLSIQPRRKQKEKDSIDLLP